MKRVLMIAYHFPPLAGSSGVQRTLRFAQQLPRVGWQPAVLSASTLAYEQTSDDLLAELPKDLCVRRAFALDTARHLQVAGRYLDAMALPDRWQSWRFDGVRQGMQLISEFKPDVIWSTYPIATAHLIAHELARRSGVPWVADFRDPMAQEGYPSGPRRWASYARVEGLVASLAKRMIFTTPGALALYQERYHDAANRMFLLENGYDEESFVAVSGATLPTPDDRPVVLLHSGVVYESERDPTQLFEALARLRADAGLGPDQLRLRFRASVNVEFMKRIARDKGVLDFLEFADPLPYREALAEMLSVDALLILQASNCNLQIPAKLYEYLRARRPILALTDASGDTATTMRNSGLPDIVALDDADAIARFLPTWLQALRAGRLTLPSAHVVEQASRWSRTRALGEMLADVA